MTVKDQMAQALSSAKSLEANMMTFEQQTQNQEAKQMFQNLCSVMGDVCTQLENRMQQIQMEEPQYNPNNQQGQ